DTAFLPRVAARCEPCQLIQRKAMFSNSNVAGGGSRARRGLAAVATGIALALASLASGAAAAESSKIKFVLDWKLQGVHAWYYLAEDRGYFDEENIDLTIDQGDGS